MDAQKQASSTDDVRSHFDRMAPDYESLINRLVPFYQKQNSLLMDLLPVDRREAFKALDLGSGPGVVSRLLLDTFPNAQVVAFDLSAVMLDTNKKKLWAYPSRAAFIQGDFQKDDFGTGYDVVLCGLILQHTDDAGKQAFFKKVFSKMNPGGTLLCRDIVRGTTPWLTEEYEKLWRLYMRAQGEDGSLWQSRFKAKDLPATVEQQLKWLRDAGFVDVDCHWRHLNFAITGGRKPK
jgi:tRNA (cmo5U34)-methyltransferase